MTDIAIRVENLSRRYRIGKRERYKTLRDTLADTFTAPFRRLRNPQSETIWALKDVSFEVKQGEVVGIPSASLRAGIGRNGAHRRDRGGPAGRPGRGPGREGTVNSDGPGPSWIRWAALALPFLASLRIGP